MLLVFRRADVKNGVFLMGFRDAASFLESFRPGSPVPPPVRIENSVLVEVRGIFHTIGGKFPGNKQDSERRRRTFGIVRRFSAGFIACRMSFVRNG